jgi:hypothetical protein
MNTKEIAQAILERRNRMNPVIMNGEMLATIGSEGMSEALQRRWLVPNTETGHLQVSTDMRVVEEMRVIADAPAPVAEAIQESACHNMAVSHSTRERGMLSELMAPMTGHDNSAPFRPQQPASPTGPATSAPGAPAAPAGAGGAAAGAAGVGDEVLVAEGGRTYTGTVGAIGQDGKYKVTFGNEKPPMNRDYGTNELKITKKAAA